MTTSVIENDKMSLSPLTQPHHDFIKDFFFFAISTRPDPGTIMQ